MGKHVTIVMPNGSKCVLGGLNARESIRVVKQRLERDHRITLGSQQLTWLGRPLADNASLPERLADYGELKVMEAGSMAGKAGVMACGFGISGTKLTGATRPQVADASAVEAVTSAAAHQSDVKPPDKPKALRARKAPCAGTRRAARGAAPSGAGRGGGRPAAVPPGGRVSAAKEKAAARQQHAADGPPAAASEPEEGGLARAPAELPPGERPGTAPG